MLVLDIFEEIDPTLFNLNRVGSNPSGAGSKIRWTAEQDDYIKQHYERCKNVKLLSQEFNTSEETMRNHLHSLGIKTLSKAEKSRSRDSFFFHNIDTPEKAYWLGFLYADGGLNEKKHEIRINLKSDDSFHLTKFLFALHALTYPINQQFKILGDKSFPISYIQMVDHQMINDLINKGCTPNKTFTVKFPTEEQVPKHLLSHFIRGVFDGDGTLSKTKAPNGIRDVYHLGFLGTKDLINGIKDYLGLNHLKSIKNNKIYGLYISGNKQILRLLNQIYQDSYYEIELDRKKERYNELSRLYEDKS